MCHCALPPLWPLFSPLLSWSRSGSSFITIWRLIKWWGAGEMTAQSEPVLVQYLHTRTVHQRKWIIVRKSKCSLSPPPPSYWSEQLVECTAISALVSCLNAEQTCYAIINFWGSPDHRQDLHLLPSGINMEKVRTFLDYCRPQMEVLLLCYHGGCSKT